MGNNTISENGKAAAKTIYDMLEPARKAATETREKINEASKEYVKSVISDYIKSMV